MEENGDTDGEAGVVPLLPFRGAQRACPIGSLPGVTRASKANSTPSSAVDASFLIVQSHPYALLENASREGFPRGCKWCRSRNKVDDDTFS